MVMKRAIFPIFLGLLLAIAGITARIACAEPPPEAPASAATATAPEQQAREEAGRRDRHGDHADRTRRGDRDDRDDRDGRDGRDRRDGADCTESGGLFAPEVIGPLVSVPTVFATAFAIVIAALVYRFRREKERLETVRYLADKGHDVPVELLAPTAKAKQNTDLRRGLVLLLGGLGVAASFAIGHQFDGMGFGVLPGLIGVAYLVVWRIERRQAATSRFTA
jgi:hypothetical protein